MILYHAVQCHDYELRHCFQVSSLLQQCAVLTPVEIVLDVAVLMGHDSALRFPAFADRQVSQNLSVSLSYHPTARATFAKRGLTRNEQAARARDFKAAWIFFGDCDHIYPPDFMRRLCQYLDGHKYDERVIANSRKLHTQIAPADALAQEARGCPYLERAYEKVLGLPMRYKTERNVAGGAMQVVSRDVMCALDWLYVDPKRCADRHLFRRHQRARSDLQFRRRVKAGSYLLDLPLQIHFDHVRDKEEGRKRHLIGVQR